jgi:AcrR family transcriptional regulator
MGVPASRTGDGYHHGDLRAACLEAAMSLLEEGTETALSLRAVARRAGVSPNAPYRHYRDKDALLAALATQGFQNLRHLMADADASAPAGEEFVALGQAYVRFALEHPGLFRLMFGHPCGRSDPETTAAAAEVTAVLNARVARLVPKAQERAFAIGSWSLVHGLASLMLDGKLTHGGPDQVDELVRGVVKTALESAPSVSATSAG